MTAAVPRRRSIVREADVITGRAVRSRTWLTAAELTNWCLGQGDVLVPAYDPDQNIAAGASKTFQYRVTPNGRAVRRVWRVYVLAATRSGTVTISAGAMAAKTVAVPVSPAGAVAIDYLEDLAAKSAATQTLTLTVACSASSGAVVVSGISCTEAPRAVLDTADLGVELTSEWAREPIDARANNSLGGIFDAHGSMRGTGGTLRRVSYLAYARPDNTTDCWSDAAGAFVPMLTAGHILTRKILAADTSRSVTFYFLCRASNATTDGEIRITNNTTAATVTLTVTDPGTTFAWYGTSLSFACEDLSQASGLPGGTFANSTFTIEFRRTGAAGTFYCASACAGE